MALLPQDPARQKLVLIALLPFVGAFAYWYFLHQPKVLDIEALEQRLETLAHSNQTARAIAANGGPELENRLAIYEQHMFRVEQLIPSREEVPALLNSVTARAQSAGVELAGYKPGGEEAGAHYSRQFYDISVLGSYHDVGQFLASIGSLPRIITATGLKLTPRPETARDGSQILNASFRIETYILPSAEDLAKATDTAGQP
jgi:type IV pilus assembly protein PilO